MIWIFETEWQILIFLTGCDLQFAQRYTDIVTEAQ